MTEEQIFKALDEMLTDNKKKNFLNHLVRAYVPVTKVEKVYEKPKIFKCVLSGDELFCVNDIIEGVNSDEFKHNFLESLKNIFKDDAEKINPYTSIVKNKKLGVVGKDTNTFMSYDTFQIFYNWVITKLLKGDKHISWLLGDINRKTFIKRAEYIDNPDVKKSLTKMNQKNNAFKPTSYSLGDVNSVLANLKQKMEDEG